MFSRVGAAAYKADLVNTLKLCEFLGNPQHRFRSVHIAGTNGKGSVSHMLAAIFQAAGYRTGLYTSPHLQDFRERIRIDGKMVEKEFVVEFTEKINPQIAALEPSFFEITVAMAFDYFANNKVDIAIIETGLGGRLDSTNVITPEVSIITHIGMDHMNILGDTLEKIAAEKAGIIKQDVPVVLGEVPIQTRAVFEEKAREMHAPLVHAPEVRQSVDWKWAANGSNHTLTVEVAEQHATDHKIYQLDLAGLYQVKNLLTVLEACHQLRQKGWKLEEEHIHKALAHVKKMTGLRGRWEVIQQSPTVVLDVAHNEDGIRQLVDQVELTDHHALHIIIGVVKDKDVDRVLYFLPKTATYYFTQANIPRALDADSLRQRAEGYHLKGKVYHDVNQALTAARNAANKKDLIIVCGSVFLVGEVGSANRE